MPKIKKRIVTAEEFDDWMATCPVPYDQTDNGLNLTESYDFDLSDVKFKFEEDGTNINKK
jgi:hypothetical protein|tara:strand:- start:492 stop:671 length:180 start_codon:yes stop_codon:yes gene_type:complete